MENKFKGNNGNFWVRNHYPKTIRLGYTGYHEEGMICEIPVSKDGEGVFNYQVQWANAKLFKASPKLLKAAMKLLEQKSEYFGSEEDDHPKILEEFQIAVDEALDLTME